MRRIIFPLFKSMVAQKATQRWKELQMFDLWSCICKSSLFEKSFTHPYRREAIQVRQFPFLLLLLFFCYLFWTCVNFWFVLDVKHVACSFHNRHIWKITNEHTAVKSRMCARCAIKDLHVMQHYGIIVASIPAKNRTSKWPTYPSFSSQLCV